MVYRMTYKWNAVSACWVVDIADSNDVPVLNGLSMITGADLLEQFAYMGFAGQLIAQTDHDADSVPTFKNLGVNGHLFFATP